jgi:hypothetical protein
LKCYAILSFFFEFLLLLWFIIHFNSSIQSKIEPCCLMGFSLWTVTWMNETLVKIWKTSIKSVFYPAGRAREGATPLNLLFLRLRLCVCPPPEKLFALPEEKTWIKYCKKNSRHLIYINDEKQVFYDSASKTFLSGSKISLRRSSCSLVIYNVIYEKQTYPKHIVSNNNILIVYSHFLWSD